MTRRHFVLIAVFVVLCLVGGVLAFMSVPFLGDDDTNVPKGNTSQQNNNSNATSQGIKLRSFTLPQDSAYRVRTSSQGGYTQAVLYFDKENEPSGIVSVGPQAGQTLEQLAQGQVGSLDNYPSGEAPTVENITIAGKKGKLVTVQLPQSAEVRVVAITIANGESLNVIFSGSTVQESSIKARLKAYAAKIKV